MGINHSRADVFEAQQFLNGPNIVTVLEQMRGKGMVERVTTHIFVDVCITHSLFNSLYHFLTLDNCYFKIKYRKEYIESQLIVTFIFRDSYSS